MKIIYEINGEKVIPPKKGWCVVTWDEPGFSNTLFNTNIGVISL